MFYDRHIIFPSKHASKMWLLYIRLIIYYTDNFHVEYIRYHGNGKNVYNQEEYHWHFYLWYFWYLSCHDSLVNELDVVKEVHEIWETKCFQTFLTCISQNNNWTVVNGFSVKTSSTQIMHIYNLGHILRLFDVLPNFPFTTGEINRDY